MTFEEKITLAIVLAVIVVAVALVFTPRDDSWDQEWDLEEMNDGVYGWYYRSSSLIFPAHSRDSIVVNIYGRIQTYEGEINVCYRDEKPRIKIIDYYAPRRRDKIYVYIPEGTLMMGYMAEAPTNEIGRLIL